MKGQISKVFFQVILCCAIATAIAASGCDQTPTSIEEVREMYRDKAEVTIDRNGITANVYAEKENGSYTICLSDTTGQFVVFVVGANGEEITPQYASKPMRNWMDCVVTMGDVCRHWWPDSGDPEDEAEYFECLMEVWAICGFFFPPDRALPSMAI